MPKYYPPDEPRPGAAPDSALPKQATRNAQSLGLLLAVIMCVLPFLLPYNQLFEAEWLAAALGVAAVLATLAVRGVSIVSLPVPARWLLAFAVFLGAQSVVVHPIYPQVPALATLYVLYAALLIWLGAQLASANGIERTATILCAYLLAGALANAASGVIQFYGIPALLQDVVAELPHKAGAYGNIAQPNMYANYLALGGTALLFLWLHRSLRTGYAVAAAVLLAWAFALSGSRTSMLYALWYVLLGLLVDKVQSGIDGRRLKFAACTWAAMIVAAHVVIPWFNASLEFGNAAKGAMERTLPTLALVQDAEPRWQIWLLAWRIFTDAPLWGNGIGEFAGAAFGSGLPPSMTQFGNQVWTSPHNFPLQLLAETGLLGAFLVFASLFTWCRHAGRRYFASAQPAMWWIIASVGIELIHSMFEYPLWSAHFLGLTALVMGLGIRPKTASRAASRLTLTATATICLALTLAIGTLLRDYVRLRSTRITGTTLTLASAADATRDAAAMRSLTHGLLAPPAEYSIILGAFLNRSQLSDRLEMSERVALHYPAHAIIVRRAVFLAFDGQMAEARRVLGQAMYTFPKRCDQTIRILAEALASDPSAVEPLLVMAKNKAGLGCS